jgi:hypothetical protein
MSDDFKGTMKIYIDATKEFEETLCDLLELDFPNSCRQEVIDAIAQLEAVAEAALDSGSGGGA